MENLITVPMTYRSGHMVIAGIGVLMQIFGAPPDDVRGLIAAIIDNIGVEAAKYDATRSDEAYNIEITLTQLDVAISAVACLCAVGEHIEGNPHTQEDFQVVGEGLDAILNANRVKGD